MVKTKTKISRQEDRKTNSELVETIRLAKKNEKWLDVASILTSPRRKRIEFNLSEIENQKDIKETLIVPGKILGQGEVSRRMKIATLAISGSAKEKLKSSGSEVILLVEEIKKNPEARGIKILRK